MWHHESQDIQGYKPINKHTYIYIHKNIYIKTSRTVRANPLKVLLFFEFWTQKHLGLRSPSVRCPGPGGDADLGGSRRGEVRAGGVNCGLVSTDGQSWMIINDSLMPQSAQAKGEVVTYCNL